MVDQDAIEFERARLHGPDVRTIDALNSALQRVGAAERDFLQVHENCIAARKRAEAAESKLASAVAAERAGINERVAQLTAHRACCGTEHDATNGKLHGYCVVCGVPWPCEIAAIRGSEP
jgi:DNA repair exonuclease SbcCD ATPase subunit